MTGHSPRPLPHVTPAARPPVARMVGAMVPVGTVLRVHSVFDRAVNLQGASDGPLVSLVLRPHDMAATAVLVDRLPDGPAVGAPVVIGPVIKPADGDSAGVVATGLSALRIVCEGIERWEGRLGVGPGDAQTVAGLGLRFEELVGKHGRDGGMLPLVSSVADTPVTRFARAALEGPGGPDWSRLVGLGIGLTPSGDDFLTGALLAERLLDICRHDTRHPDIRRRVPGRVGAGRAPEAGLGIHREVLAGRLRGTTAAGRTLLGAALEERFPAYLLTLVQTALQGEALIADHLDHGHSSATDAVCGIIVRLRMER